MTTEQKINTKSEIKNLQSAIRNLQFRNILQGVIRSHFIEWL